jgi:protein-S-isoprenylcysteine O-methyltransferase Ste14
LALTAGVSETTAGPGVRVPPPLIFAGGWLAAWYLDREFPFEIDGAGTSWAQAGLGVLLIGVGLSLIVAAGGALRRAQTPIRPDRPARVLVTGGPFRWTRNPLYLGLTAIYAGAAALANAAWPIVFLPIVLIVLTTTVVHREEEHLRGAFPEYEDYSRRVRRWL